MKITIEVNSDEEYRLALLKYMPMLGELGDSTVEIVKFDNVEDRTLDMVFENLTPDPSPSERGEYEKIGEKY